MDLQKVRLIGLLFAIAKKVKAHRFFMEQDAGQTNARQWEEVLAGVVSTMQDWEEDVLRVTRLWAGRRMPSDAISNS